jgi:hypothetical protein
MELLKRDPSTNEIFTALDIVKDFIIERGLILTGGMVIDIATKMKGKKGLYGSDEVPDYDCLSPQFYEDSMDLITLLEGDEVSLIPAMHVQTLRTRVDFQPVADITLCDKNIFDQIPFLVVPDGFEQAGMKIIHPHYQIIDQYRSLSYPMEGFPRYSIFNRMVKDMKRHDILLDAYPITGEMITETTGHTVSLKEISEMFDHFKIKEDYVLYGETAYHFITNTVGCDCVELLSDSHELFKEGKKFSRHLDIIPGYIMFEFRGKQYKIYDNLNSKICKHKNGVCVSSNNVKMYLLFKYFIYGDEKYLSYYLNLKDETMLPDIKNLYGKSNTGESYRMAHEELLHMNEFGKKESRRFKAFYPDYGNDMDDKIKKLIAECEYLYDLPDYKGDGKEIIVTHK